MQPSIRYALAVLAGIVAGALAALGAGPVVDPGHAWLVAGFTGLVWTAATALYLGVYDELDGVPADPDRADPWAGAKWGGIAGGLGSVGIAGAAILLSPLVAFRYVAVVGLFAFGLFLGGMAVGTGALASRFDGVEPTSESGPTAGSDGVPTDD